MLGALDSKIIGCSADLLDRFMDCCCSMFEVILTEFAVFELWKHDECRTLYKINVLQDEGFCLKLEVNAVLKFLVWWRMVELCLQDGSWSFEPGSEEFWQEVLVSEIYCFGVYMEIDGFGIV